MMAIDSGKYMNIGEALAKKGEYDKALLVFNKAIEINPKCAQAYFGRGNVFFAKGLLNKAIIDYNKSISLDPSYGGCY